MAALLAAGQCQDDGPADGSLHGGQLSTRPHAV